MWHLHEWFLMSLTMALLYYTRKQLWVEELLYSGGD